MSSERRRCVADSALTLVDNLEDYVADEAAADEAPARSSQEAGGEDEIPTVSEVEHEPFPDGENKLVVCVGGRGELDNAAIAMLSQVLKAQGANTRTVDHLAMDPRRIRDLDLSGAHSVVIGFLNMQSTTQARYIVRRIKRARSSLRVGVVFWMQSGDAVDGIKLGATIGGDFVAHNMREAVVGALSDEQPQAIQSGASKVRTRASRLRSAAIPAARPKAG